MATVTQLLRVLQIAVATSQAHHKCLGVVEGGGLVIQAVGADGGFDHVELLQLVITTEGNDTTAVAHIAHTVTSKAGAGGEQN